MKKFKSFLATTFLGGVIVVLPVAILVAVFGWVFNFITSLIQPLTDVIVARSATREIIAVVLVILIILGVCFMIGIVVRTRFGKLIFVIIEKRLFKIIPGYSLIKETILQLLGGNKAVFSSVALAQIFGNNTLVTAFVTDEHANGNYSVFVPTGPNPTSGNIYHLEKKFVHPLDISVEDAMRSIISCGYGSKKLIEEFESKK